MAAGQGSRRGGACGADGLGGASEEDRAPAPGLRNRVGLRGAELAQNPSNWERSARSVRRASGFLLSLFHTDSLHQRA